MPAGSGAAVPDRGGRAGAVGDRHVRAAETQDLDELLEDDPVTDQQGGAEALIELARVGALYLAPGSSVALGSIEPQLVGRAGGEVGIIEGHV